MVSRGVGDSKIIMKRTQHNNDQQARICGAEMVAETSNLQKGLNTGKILFI